MHNSVSILPVVAALALAACAQTPKAPAWRETAAVSQIGDAADDPAIWVAPQPEQSLVIATQKKGGLYVFDLAGAIVQEAPGGMPNNVDLRDAFPWSDGAAPIVGASDRSDNAIVLWRFDSASKRLDPTPRARIATGFTEIYGFCLGHVSGDWIAVASDKGGEIGVWKITQGEDGAPRGERIVNFNLGSITEGCVVDDDAGVYYLAQELVGLWRVPLNDATGAGRTQIGAVGDKILAADVEGVALWRGAGGDGYIIASVQGRSRYAVYERRAPNAYIGSFAIGPSADGRADAVSGTDGIDVVSTPIGSDLPRGLFVAQDDRNTTPSELQNFKYASWADIEAALALQQKPQP